MNESTSMFHIHDSSLAMQGLSQFKKAEVEMVFYSMTPLKGGLYSGSGRSDSIPQ